MKEADVTVGTDLDTVQQVGRMEKAHQAELRKEN